MVECGSCGKETGQSIEGLCVDCYLDQFSPSSFRKRPWLYANNFKYDPVEKTGFDSKLMEAIMSSKIMIEDSGFRIQFDEAELLVPFSVEAVDDVARRSGILVGKWLVYRGRSEIDDVWRGIASHTFRGELGTSAKVSTELQGRDRRVICVYTRDYLDLDDVMSVREKLSGMGFKDRLCYKPDIYTYFGIYYRTTPLSACRYRS